MLDRERVLAKMAELEGFLSEISAVSPRGFEDFLRVETKRACERLLQISIEAAIEICYLFVAGLRLGLPGEEDDLFESWSAPASSRRRLPGR